MRYKLAMSRLIRSLALALSLAMISLSQEAPKGVFPFDYTQEDLPNGLRVVTIPTDFPNLVSIFVVVQVGSRNEVEPGKSGFAHLFEHVMFRGTEKYPPAKREEAMKRAGAASNAFTSSDLTAYYATFAKEDIEQILEMEADRFQNLKYSEEVFKTETGAVLGEFNKNSADPEEKVWEVLHDTAYDRHTYKHTTMGFLEDVQDMPNQYDYSLRFFDRYYRPEYTTIIVAGDVEPKQVRALVDKHWGEWKRGSYHPDIPVEPKQTGAREKHVDWPTETLPWVYVAYKGPAYTDSELDTVGLDVLATLAFSENSDLYRKLVIEEQKVDQLGGSGPANVDPSLFTISARVKDAKDVDYVRGEILKTIERFREELIAGDKLEAVKKRERYSFVMRMDNNEAVARNAAFFVALKRTPATIDRMYEQYDKLTPALIRAIARRYLSEDNRTIVTLTGPGGEAPAGGAQ